jgi:hypothetical protein
MYNRIRLSVLLLLACTSSGLLGFIFTGHSIFSIRTPFQTASPEKEALWHYDWLKTDASGTVEVVPFGGQTFGNHVGEFFAPFGATTLRVSEFKEGDDSTNNDLDQRKDIEARHFNIETKAKHNAFRSTVCLKPKLTFAGVGFAWRQSINDCWWFDISFPVEHVSTKFKVTEVVHEDGGGAVEENGLQGLPRVGNVKDSLKSKLFKFGRIEPDRKHSKTGVADVEARVGWNTYDNGEAHLRSYVGVVFPTGNKPDPEFLFTPVVGNNKHFGLMFGSNIGFCVWECGNHKLRQEIDAMGRYLFPNHQCRSFDFVDKEWGRYQEFYKDEAQAKEAEETKDPRSGTSGINIFTQRVKVEPRFSTTFNTAVIYEYCEWLLAEFGYNFYARQAEHVELCGFKNKATFKHVDGKGLTSFSRTLFGNFKGDKVAAKDFTPVARHDLDLTTAGHPVVILQIFYGALGVKSEALWCPTTFSVGGSYEFSHINSGPKKWSVWGKASVDF